MVAGVRAAVHMSGQNFRSVSSAPMLVYSSPAERTINDHLMELFLLVRCMKRYDHLSWTTLVTLWLEPLPLVSLPSFPTTVTLDRSASKDASVSDPYVPPG
eukprot:765800-Hanusia_phi.AAC.2